MFLQEKTTWLWCGICLGRSCVNTPEHSCSVASYCLGVCFSVIQVDLNHTPEPRHVLSRHSLPITDLHCGMMGVQARVVTASLDQTVKVRCHTCSDSTARDSTCPGATGSPQHCPQDGCSFCRAVKWVCAAQQLTEGQALSLCKEAS